MMPLSPYLWCSFISLTTLTKVGVRKFCSNSARSVRFWSLVLVASLATRVGDDGVDVLARTGQRTTDVYLTQRLTTASPVPWQRNAASAGAAGSEELCCELATCDNDNDDDQVEEEAALNQLDGRQHIRPYVTNCRTQSQRLISSTETSCWHSDNKQNNDPTSAAQYASTVWRRRLQLFSNLHRANRIKHSDSLAFFVHRVCSGSFYARRLSWT